LKCVSLTDKTQADCVVLIKDGKTDHDCARKYHKKA
jgi:hypothetical protein